MTENSTTQQIGKCLCGDVQVSISTSHTNIGSCHCKMCQRWSGGPFLSLEVGDEFTLTGKNSLKTYASSDWAERAFCGNCGSNIYYHLKPANGYYFLAGLFQESNQSFVLHHQIYIDQKPDFYNFAESTETLTAAQVEAMFSV